MKRARVDVFDAPTAPRVFVLDRGERVLVAIVDGSGSWGSGQEAADRAREQLATRWRDASAWSADGLARDIQTVAASTPADLRDPDFGWSFSVTCLLCEEDAVTCVATGFYRVDVLGASGVTPLFRPQSLVDQLLAQGALTPETAASFPHREICLGPFVGDAPVVTLTTARHELLAGERLIVTHASRFDLNRLGLAESAAALAARARQGAPPSPVIVVTAARSM